MPVKPTHASGARSGPIVVIGSLNMDLVCRVDQIPRPGQTVMGADLMTIPGGKGANQAVAAARLGGDVHMIGRVGDDDFGQRLLSGLQRHGVKTRWVTVAEGIPSGVATITVDGGGENAIVVAPGANHRLSPGDIDLAESLIASASVVVMQLEIPLETVARAIELCRRHDVRTILDPAPVPVKGLPPALYAVDIFTPNQTEAEQLVADSELQPARAGEVDDPRQLGCELLQRGPSAVVLKLGARGAMVMDRQGGIEMVAAKKVNVVDTTAAGDAFTGALAVALSEGAQLPQAADFATTAGSLCCTKFGAQPSLPDRAAVQAFERGR